MKVQRSKTRMGSEEAKTTTGSGQTKGSLCTFELCVYLMSGSCGVLPQVGPSGRLLPDYSITKNLINW